MIQIFIILLFLPTILKASHDLRTEESPCGLLEQVMGSAQILQPNQSVLTQLQKKQAIACGSWISTLQGWVQIKHLSGAQLQIGPESFVQLTQKQSPHISVYYGKMYAKNENGSQTLHLISPTSHVTLKQGQCLLLARSSDDQTQLIVLKGQANFENRFEPKHKVLLNAGESSIVNLTLQKIFPSIPQAIAVATLKPFLQFFRLNDHQLAMILKLAHERQERVFASDFLKTETTGHLKTTSHTKITEYAQTLPEAQDPRVLDHLMNKVVGGYAESKDLLFPQKNQKKSEKVQIVIQDLDTQNQDGISRATQEEKNRILRELSQIQAK